MASDSSTSQRAPVLPAVALLVASLVAAVYLLSWMRYGLDLSDEASEINWIRSPWSYPLSTTQYGFFYAPFHAVLKGDIALLRAANFVLTVGLGSWTSYLLLSLPAGAERSGDRSIALVLSLPLGLAAWLVSVNWLATPNYNFLNLQGLLVATAALLLIVGAPVRGRLPAFLLLGMGGWMTFLAKPPSAVLLAALALAVLLLLRRLRLAGLAVAVATAGVLLAATAFFADGSIGRFISRLSGAAVESRAADSHYDVWNLLRFDDWHLPALEIQLLLMLAAVVAVTILIASWRLLALRIGGRLIIAGIVLAGLAQLFGVRLLDLSWADRYLLQLLAIPLGAAVALAVACLADRRAPSTRFLVVAALLLILPYAFAVGTNGIYWWLAATAGLFWCAAAVAILKAGFGSDSRVSNAALAVVAISFAATLLFAAIGLDHPYRQPQSLRLNQSPVEIGGTGDSLILSADYARYVQALRDAAATNGFTGDTPLLDLTGHYPGASVVLGAPSAARAWVIGGYPGSEAVARSSLLELDCPQLASLWLLTEPAGPRAIPQTVLPAYGLSYADVATLAAPTGDMPEGYEQHLMKPVHDRAAAIASCQAAAEGRK